MAPETTEVTVECPVCEHEIEVTVTRDYDPGYPATMDYPGEPPTEEIYVNGPDLPDVCPLGCRDEPYTHKEQCAIEKAAIAAGEDYEWGMGSTPSPEDRY